MLGGLGSDLNLGGLRGGLGVLGDPFLDGSSQVERDGSYFWNLGRDSPDLVHGSCEGSHRG